MELTRRRAQDLDDALSADLAPEQADGLAREVALVAHLREMGPSCAQAPSEDFRTALRGRLMAVAAVQGIGETASAPSPEPGRRIGAVPTGVPWRQRAATVAAGALASVVAVTGVSVAASWSLPGDPFYGVKRTTEDVQLRLAGGAEDEGVRHLQFAATRMDELRSLALGRDLSGAGTLSDGDAGRVSALLDDMDADTRRGQLLLVDVFRSTGSTEPLERLARFADRQSAGLQEVLPTLPAGVRPRALASLTLVTDLRSTAGELLLLRDCTAVCDPAATAPAAPGGAPGSCECPVPPPAPEPAPPPAADPVPAPPPAVEPPPPPAVQGPVPVPPPANPAPVPAPGLPVPGVPAPDVPVPGATAPSVPLAPLPGVDLGDPLQVPPLVGDGSVTEPLTGSGGLLGP
jgi:hypothetical protein